MIGCNNIFVSWFPHHSRHKGVYFCISEAFYHNNRQRLGRKCELSSDGMMCRDRIYSLCSHTHTYKYLLNYQNKKTFYISACTLIIFPFNFRTGGHFIIAELDFLVNKLFSFQGQGSFFVNVVV